MTSPRDPTLPKLPDDVEALTDLTLAVFRLHGALLEWGDALVAPLGLSSARWQMLGALAIAGKALTAPQVGQAMGVSRQGAQKQLNVLLELGLVEANANPAHRRSPLYTLTSRGRKLYLRAEALWAEQAGELVKRLPLARIRTTTQTLDVLLRHLSPSDRFSEDLP